MSAPAMPTAAPLLEVDGVHAGYGKSAVLADISFTLAAGEAMTLLGRNGMGKSTLLKCLVGWVAPSAGRIRFAGEDVTGWAPDRLARAGIAIVPEGRQVFPNLSVHEHLVAFAANRARSGEPWTVERLYAFLPRLAERAQNLGGQLSGGEQQMLAIARALVTNPRLLILDEATEGLAPLIREDIWRSLAQLRAAGQTLIVVDKYVRRLLPLTGAHRILERGRIVWAGDSAALDADHAVWQRYLGV